MNQHLITALRRALERYGAPDSRLAAAPPAEPDPLAPDATVPLAPKRVRSVAPSRLRQPGWVTVGEIEASQSPNTYPRLTRKAIREGCRALEGVESSPVAEVRSSGLRTWVRVVPVVAQAPVVSEPAPIDEAVATPVPTDVADAHAPGGAPSLGADGFEPVATEHPV
ncbi:MAG: hypothetical protein WD336_05395 [Trueperaceae bacterium]